MYEQKLKELISDNVYTYDADSNNKRIRRALAAIACYARALIANTKPDYWFEWLNTRVHPADNPSSGSIPATTTQDEQVRGPGDHEQCAGVRSVL